MHTDLGSTIKKNDQVRKLMKKSINNNLVIGIIVVVIVLIGGTVVYRLLAPYADNHLDELKPSRPPMCPRFTVSSTVPRSRASAAGTKPAGRSRKGRQ
jgi:hypothetical protein